MSSPSRCKRPTVFIENGKEYIFNSSAFKTAVDAVIIDYRKENNKERGSKADVYRFLAAGFSYKSTQTVENIKKWHMGRNGPSNIEDVKAMEKVLGCALLMPRPVNNTLKAERGENDMKESIRQMDVNMDETQRNSARKVYGIVCDLIRAQQKLLNNYWSKGFPVVADDCVPDNFPVYSDIQNEIRKCGFDLSRDLIEDIMRFVRGIYGSWDIHLEGAAADLDIDKYKKMFDDWLGRSGGQEDFFEWCEFLNEYTQSNYELLDEIFDAFIFG